ncbi:DMT family transporter [Sanyastnella coralliicola]|uniref:DMT family transporter n=1 Tax=Sanyastnella coralliicola TaxID=3069118 RepID=UPI0027B9E109|nr:EamA family transporter [Longitalea sp. SCSIO 12813]
MNSRTKNLLLMHVIVLIFGFTGILGKLISIDAVPLVFWRCAIAAAALGLFLGFNGNMRRYEPKVVLQMAGIGLVAAAHWITFFAAIKVSTVSVALATLASSALFVSIFDPLVTKRKLDYREIILGVLVIVGLIFIFSFETQYKLGILLALISAFLAGAFSTFNAIQIKHRDAVNISFYEMLSATIGVLIYLYATGGVNEELVELSREDWTWLLLLGTIATAFAFVISVEVMKVLSPFTVALTINLEPVYSILLALLIFGEEEKMTSGFYLGAIIILGSLFVDALMKRKGSEAKNDIGTLDSEETGG